MAVKRLRPKNDFIFQRLFGERETKESLISLLNAILRLEDHRRIVDLTVVEKNKELLKELVTDKTGRLDIRAETLDQVQINIEVQLIDRQNMIKRTLFYLGKMYVESIKSGGKYENLKKTITINLLEFNLFDFERFHSTYHFYEDHEQRFMMTDVFEVHMIECPKFAAAHKNLQDPLHRWLLFLDDRLPENQLEELIRMDPVIQKTEARLEWLSGDEETLRLYEAREFSRIEHDSLMAEAEAKGLKKGIEKGIEQGIEQGIEKGIEKVALSMLSKGFAPSLIAEMTGLSEEEIARLGG
ncbi:MAG: Rpn family recombination-promoting nuclease/putative transposase [Paenibacillaceae bacterium]|nr:Rpn family recombination-promoting nuclease/putative transposase [Paenibacillaceae bacterium]